MDAIITRAGVGRQTVYRWWKSKQAVLMEVVTEGLLGAAEGLDSGDEDPMRRLELMISRLAEAADGPANAALIRALAAAAAGDAHDAEALYEAATGPVLAMLVDALGQARAVGAVRPSLDLNTSADAVMGILLFRVLTGRPTGEDVVRSVLHLLTDAGDEDSRKP